MRLDSPFVLALAGTIAIHTIFVVAADAVVVTNPYRPAPPAPRISLVDVELPPPPPPPPLPPPPPPVRPEVATPVEREPTPRSRQRIVERTTEPPPETPPPAVPVNDDAGGDEVVRMDDIAPAATGVPVKRGPRNTGHIGRGGSGGGTGAGTGSGTADVAAPMSVATIKTRALPKGDYGYFKDYPAAARQLGIEGTIKVRLVVDATGKVRSAVLLNKLGHGLDELALTRARQIQFTPATDTDDRAVSSVVVWTFHMTLPR